MRLSQREIKKVKTQMQAEPVPSDHPALSHLKTYIGDHTFYIGSEGVFIWEYAGGDGEKNERINALRVASWADPGKRTIAMHTPQITETVVMLTADQVAKAKTPPPVSEALETEGPNAAPESAEIAPIETTEPATVDSESAKLDLLIRIGRIFESAGEPGKIFKSKPAKTETAGPATEDAHAEDGIPKDNLWEDKSPKKKTVKDDPEPAE